MSHIVGKVYDLTQENMQKIIAELELTKKKLDMAMEAIVNIRVGVDPRTAHTANHFGEEELFYNAFASARQCSTYAHEVETKIKELK